MGNPCSLPAIKCTPEDVAWLQSRSRRSDTQIQEMFRKFIIDYPMGMILRP